jgi:hypothetical protein
MPRRTRTVTADGLALRKARRTGFGRTRRRSRSRTVSSGRSCSTSSRTAATRSASRRCRGTPTCLVVLPATQSATTSVATSSPSPPALCSSSRFAHPSRGLARRPRPALRAGVAAGRPVQESATGCHLRPRPGQQQRARPTRARSVKRKRPERRAQRQFRQFRSFWLFQNSKQNCSSEWAEPDIAQTNRC